MLYVSNAVSLAVLKCDASKVGECATRDGFECLIAREGFVFSPCGFDVPWEPSDAASKINE